MSDSPQQDLSQLEMAFASDPKAFVPLTNAYISLGRYMEAMVVCKKGIKALPDSVDGKLLLARVYAEQGKYPKALEEVKALLTTNGDSADVHYAHAQMLEKSGRFEEAIEAFKETIRKNRKHTDAVAALKAKGVDFDPGPSPEELAEKAAAEEAERRRVEEEAAAKLAAEQEAARAAEEARQRAESAKAAAMSAALHGAAATSTPPGRAPSTSSPPAGVVSAPPQPVDPAFAALYAQTLYGYQGGEAADAGKKKLGFGFTFGLAGILLVVTAGLVGGLYLHRKQQDEVLDHLKRAQAVVKHDTTKGYKEGLKELDAAIKIDDDNEIALGQRAYALSVLSERGFKEADPTVVKAAVEAAAKKAPDNVASIASQMRFARSEGRLDDAVGLAQKAAKGSDEKSLPTSIRVELGRAYTAQGKIPQMVAIADSLRDATDANGLTFAGETYRRIGDTFKARKAFDDAVKNELEHDPARALRALLILEQDDVTNLPIALDDVTSLLDLGKDALGSRQYGYAILGRALIAQRSATSREVARDIESARSVLRSDPEMLLFDAKQAMSNEDWAKAETLLRDAIKNDAYRLAPYLELVEVGSRAKKFDVADKALTDAQTTFGDNLALGLARGQRLLAEGKTDDALTFLQGLQKTFDLAEVHLDIGKVYMKKDDAPNAVASLKKAAEKAGARSPGVQARCYTWLGRALAQAGDHEQAKESYAQALSITTEFPSTYYFLAVSLAELKKNDEAKDALNKYLKAEGNGPYAEKARAKLAEL